MSNRNCQSQLPSAWAGPQWNFDRERAGNLKYDTMCTGITNDATVFNEPGAATRPRSNEEASNWETQIPTRSP